MWGFIATFFVIVVAFIALVALAFSWKNKNYLRQMQAADGIATKYAHDEAIALYNYGLTDLHTAAQMRIQGDHPPVPPYLLIPLVVAFWVKAEESRGNVAPDRRMMHRTLSDAVTHVLQKKPQDFSMLRIFTDLEIPEKGKPEESVGKEWTNVKREYQP